MLAIAFQIAHAERRAIFLGVRPLSEAAVPSARALEDSVRAALQSAGVGLLEHEDPRVARLAECGRERDLACLIGTTRSLEIEFVGIGALDGDGRVFDLDLEVTYGSGRDPVKEFRFRLPAGTPDQSAARLAPHVVRAATGPYETGEIVVDCSEEAAELRFDGSSYGRVGRAPVYLGGIAPGVHDLELVDTHGQRWRRTVRVLPGTAEHVRVILSSEDVRPGGGHTGREHVATSRSRWIGFWIATGVAVLAATTGAVLGTGVWKLERQKEDGIRDSRIGRHPNSPGFINAGPDEDACAEAEADDAASHVARTCRAGRLRAISANVAFGVAGLSAAVAGYFFHRANTDDRAAGPSAEAGLVGLHVSF